MLLSPYPYSVEEQPRWRQSRRWSSATTPFLSLLLCLLLGLFVVFRKSGFPFGSFALFGSHEVDWSRFAYAQYATNKAYLCNSVMLFESLHRLGSKADRVLLYAKYDFTEDDELLEKARTHFNVRLVPIDVIHHTTEPNEFTWADSLTKLLAFGLSDYDRVLHLDSDAVVLQSMDELFLLPPATVAMPHAYWAEAEGRPWFSTQVLLITPSETEFARVRDAIDTAGPHVFDMDLMNQLYGNSCEVIPHRRYNILTKEFRQQQGDHAAYLGGEDRAWDPEVELLAAKYVHFSDWPVAKPWVWRQIEMMDKYQPPCFNRSTGGDPPTALDCRARRIWRGFYDDFAARRKEICSLDINEHHW